MFGHTKFHKLKEILELHFRNAACENRDTRSIVFVEVITKFIKIDKKKYKYVLIIIVSFFAVQRQCQGSVRLAFTMPTSDSASDVCRSIRSETKVTNEGFGRF